MGRFLLNKDVSEAGSMFRFFVSAYLVQTAEFGTDLPIVVSILAETAIIKELAGHISSYDIQC